MNAIFYIVKPAKRAPETNQVILSIFRAVQGLAGPLAIAHYLYIGGR